MDNLQTADSTAGNSPAPVQPGSGTANSLPSGQRSISDSDFQRFQRQEQQVRGFEPYGQRFAKLGIKSPEDLDRLLSQNGDANRAPESNQAAKPADPVDVDKMVKAALARERHSESRKSESQVIEKLAKKLAGEDADEFTLDDVRLQVSARLNELRNDEKFEANFYPPDHALHTEALAPYGDKHAEAVESWWTERKTKREAARMQQTAKDANRPTRPRPSPSGSSGGQGKPETSNQARSAAEHVDSVIDGYLASRT